MNRKSRQKCLLLSGIQGCDRVLNVDRWEIIKKFVNEKGQVQIKELETLIPQVSSMTLRRDLSYLESKGFLIRMHGGARSVNNLYSKDEDAYSFREMENIDAKFVIAHKASDFIEPHRSVYIDSGTTTMCLAKTIPDKHLSIVTNGPNIALEIIKKLKPSVTLIGGEMSRISLSVTGANSIKYIKDINIDIAFMAASGFSLDSGFTCGNFNECELKKYIIKKSKRTILLMDNSKIDKNMPFTFAALKDIDILITESRLPDTVVDAAEKSGVSII